MRYLLGLVRKSAPAQPARSAAAYALEEEPAEAAPAADSSAPPRPATSLRAVAPERTAHARAGDGERDAASDARGANAGSAARDTRDVRDVAPPVRETNAAAEIPRARSAEPPARDAAQSGTPQRGVDPARDVTHERVVVERTHERTTRVERVERATTILRPAAPVAALAAPVVSATARRAVPSQPAVPPLTSAPRVPDVTIAIGTIEVRGAGAPAAPPPSRAHRPRLSLDEYLASRSGVR